MQRLMSGVVDFAGTFPPARLSTAASVERYLDGCSGKESWILGHYVCSTSQLNELATTLKAKPTGSVLSVCAVGAPSADRASWEAGLARDAQTMNDFSTEVSEIASIEAYEVPLPRNADLEHWERDLGGFGAAEVFVELPPTDQVEDLVARVAETDELGAKLRTGGVELAAFPSIPLLARFIRACVGLEVAFKLTAGLHQPFPRLDPETGATMHGFVNVLTATALSLSEDLSCRELEEVLADRDPSSWRFDDRGMSWRDFRVSLAGIDETRGLFTAIGSCSIDDPINGLKSFEC